MNTFPKIALLTCLSFPGLVLGQQPAPAPAATPQSLAKTPTAVVVDKAAAFTPMGSTWNATAGYQYRQIGDLDFKTGSQAARGTLPWMAGRGRSGSSSSAGGAGVSSFSRAPDRTSTGDSPSSTTATTGSNANVGSAGPATANADRTYSNGYVNQFPGTAATGQTWNWGYTSAGQNSGNTLSFQTTAPGATTTTTNRNTTTTSVTSGSTFGSSTLRTTTSYSSSSSSWRSLGNDLDWGSELEGSGGFARIESPAIFSAAGLAVSMELGYSFAGADASRRNANAFRAHQRTEQRMTSSTIQDTTLVNNQSTTVTSTTSGSTSTTTGTNTINDQYTYNPLLLIPAAPYNGTTAGPGPLIPNQPTNRTVTTANTTTTTNDPGGSTTTTTSTQTTDGFSEVVGSSSAVSVTTADFFSTISESMDVDLHTLSFGPRFSWELSRLRVGLSTGLAINIADWEATYREDLYVSRNGGKARLLKSYRDNDGGTKVLPGFYLEANANVRLTERIALFAGGRYDWADSLTGSVGPSSFSLDLGGWTALGGVTVSF